MERELDVYLTGSDPGELADQSVALQQAFRRNDKQFKINSQFGLHAHFIVEAKSCAEHLQKALHKLGFNVIVTGQPESLIPKESCHDCQMGT